MVWLHIPSRPQDNWICVGPHYAEHLARTAPFNATRLLSQFPPGTRIFAEGNSWFGELVLTLICQSVDDPQLRVWNPIAAAGTMTFASFWTMFHAFLSSTPPHTCRVLRSTWCPC